MMILELGGITVAGRFFRMARPRNEWINDVEDPAAIIRELKAKKIKADLFTFWQRYPETKPRFSYPMEWDNWAVLPVTTAEEWFLHQISNKLRAKVRKAPKMGVEVKIVPLDDAYIAGVTKLFNETSVRQGKRFAHFGKTFQQVKEELSSEAARTDFIGAYYQGEMIGFIQQVYIQDGAYPFGGVSSVAHRDKSPNNAMMAKAVESCVARGGKYLVYGNYDYGTGGGGLTEFKAQNGFQKMLVPRYYVPLTLKGRLGLALNLHHGVKRMVPRKLLRGLIVLRRKWNVKRTQGGNPAS